MENLDLTHLPRGQKNTESPVSIFRVKLDQNGLNGHLLGWKPCKLLNAIALGQIKAMNKKTAFTAGLK